MGLVACGELESTDKAYANLGRAMRQYVHLMAVRATAEELFARMVLNLFVTNDDDHLRNHGFVRDPRLGGCSAPCTTWCRGLCWPGSAGFTRGGVQSKLATLDKALSHCAAFVSERPEAVAIMRPVWGEVRQWKTCHKEHGADGKLIDQLTWAVRDLSDKASPELEAEIRKGMA